MRLALIAITLVIVVECATLFVLFVPVVSLEADVPGSGGISTTVTTQNGTTTTQTLVSTPAFGQGYGSITFCLFGQGALFIQGSYYPLIKATLQTEGAFCPALNHGS